MESTVEFCMFYYVILAMSILGGLFWSVGLLPRATGGGRPSRKVRFDLSKHICKLHNAKASGNRQVSCPLDRRGHLTEEDTEDTEGLKQLWSEWELVESQAPNLF